MEFEDVIYEAKDAIARISINRPDVLNALRSQTYDELADAFALAADDDSIGVVVFRGVGGRAFSSGGDVRGQKIRTPSIGRWHLRKCLELSHIMRNCGKPIIAAVDGYALGGGHELHLFCDLTIATESSQFGQVGPSVGSVPIWGATQLLPLMVGDKKAREIIYLCHRYSAEEALDMGLINRVVPKDKLEDAVDEWCQEILDKSQQSLRIAKLMLNAVSDTVHASYAAGVEMLSLTYGSEENLEGVNAFLEKRPVDFRRYRPKETSHPQAPSSATQTSSG